MESGIEIMEKNKVILMYKAVYDEIGSFTANSNELLVLTKDKCAIYHAGSGYEGDDDHIASRFVDLKARSKFIDDCFKHILFSYENKENVVDCDGYGGTNSDLFQVRIVNEDEVDTKLLNGEIYFEREYEIIKELKFKEYYAIKPFAYSLAGIIPSHMWPNFIKTYISPVEELAKKTWQKEEKDLQADKSFTGVNCGLYPQSELKDEDVIKLLNEKYGTPDTNTKWCDFGYRANDYQGGYMFYIDVELGDDKYRGVYIKEFRPNSSGDNIARNFDSIQAVNGFEKNTIYWFKFEPLVWVKYGTSYNQCYLCLNVIDAEPMYDKDPHGDKDGGANSFYNVSSSLRKWLKDTFAKTAFPEGNLPFIEVDLLSKKDYLDNFPLKKQRKPRPTDYALIKGYLPDSRSRGNDFPFVWTATYIEGFNRMVSISKDGSIIDFYSENHGYIDYVYGGVQPAIFIDGRKRISDDNKIKIDFNTLKDRIDEKEGDTVELSDFFTAEQTESTNEKSNELLIIDDDNDLPF